MANQSLLAPGEKAEFQWYKDGAPYDPEERFKVDFKVHYNFLHYNNSLILFKNVFLCIKDEEDTLSLVFQHVKPEDAGLYTCVAATSTGKISCSAELTVQGIIYEFD